MVNNETTLLALFPFDAALDDHFNFTRAIDQARLTRVLPTVSWVEVNLTDSSAPNHDMTYKAVVVTLPLLPLTVHLEGHESALQLIRQALAQAGSIGGASLLVCEVDETAELRLTAADSRFRIT